MKLKKTLLLSTVLLAIAACTDKDNSVKVEMKSCEGTLCSFDASKSKIKSHSKILEYDWNFHDDTDMTVTKDPKVSHDFNIHVGATLDGNDLDLDLRDVTLDEILTGHKIITKEFVFRTHQHDPQPSFTAEETQLLLGSSEGSATVFNLDASASEPGQGTIKGYIWEIDGQKIKTEIPELQHTFSEKSSGDVKLTVVNSFGVETSIVENVHILQNEPRVTSVDIFRASKTDELYDFRADFDDFDSEKYSLIWELNQVDLGMPDTKEIKNIRVNKGSNEISAILKNKSNGREVSHVTRVFDTGDISFVKITSLNASFVKYSDGLHYDFSTDIKNFDSTGDELIYELNGDRIFSNTNIKVNEGENTIVAKVVDKQTKEVLTEKAEPFIAKKLPLNISHVIANQSSDRKHYNFYDLTYSFDDETQYKEWELNGTVIYSTDDVLVANGKNEITLYIKDKLTKEILDKKSKNWDVSNIVEIKQVNAEEIANSDGLHYALSAEFDEHFNPNEQYVAWTVNGEFIDDPSNVLVENGLNKFIVYIYDKASGDLIAAANTKVNVSIHQPKIKTVEINVDDDLKKEGLEYSFDAVIDNYDDARYKKEWLLNGKKLDSTKQVDVLTGYNTLELYLINTYTSETAGYYKTDFVARGGNATIKSLTPDKLDGKNGLHYRAFLETDKYDSSVYNIDWSLNDKTLPSDNLDDFVVNLGKNEIKATISYKSTDEVSDQRTVEFNAEINKPSVDILLAEPNDNDSLEYQFKSSINYNFRNHNDFEIIWLIDSVPSDIPSKDDTQYTFSNNQTGEHSIIFALKDISTGEMYQSSPTTIFVKQNSPVPVITSIDEHKYINRDGLDYSFEINYENPDIIDYSTKFVLNKKLPLQQIDDVRVERGENIFTAEIINNKTGDSVHTYDIKFDAELNDINIKSISAVPRSLDGLEYNLKTDLELNNRNEKDLSISWFLDGNELSGTSGANVNYSFNAENLGKHTIEAKVKDSVTGKTYEKEPVEINVEKALSKPTSKVSVIPDANNGLKFYFSREIDWNGRDSNDFDVQWLIDGKNGTGLDKLGESFDYEFPKNKEGYHYVKLTLIEKATKLEFKSESVNISVKDTSIPYEDTPAAIIGQGIHSEHKGNSGASFPYITIDLNESVQNKGVNFITGERLWNGKVGNNDTPYEQGNSYLHFNTGSATQEGFYDFSIELAKGDIHQVGTYSCKQKTTLWAIVWEPDLYDCTPIVWKDAYKV